MDEEHRIFIDKVSALTVQIDEIGREISYMRDKPESRVSQSNLINQMISQTQVALNRLPAQHTVDDVMQLKYGELKSYFQSTRMSYKDALHAVGQPLPEKRKIGASIGFTAPDRIKTSRQMSNGDQVQLLYEDTAKNRLAFVEKRNQQIESLTTSLTSLNETVQDMNTILSEQTSQLEIIESNADSASHYLEKGANNMAIAESRSKRRHPWRCTTFGNNCSSEKLAWYINQSSINEQSKTALLQILRFDPNNPKHAEYEKEEGLTQEEKPEEVPEETKEEKKEEKTEEKPVKQIKPVIKAKPIKYTTGYELDGYVRLLTTIILYKEGKIDSALNLANDLISRISSMSIDQQQPLFDVLAKTYYYHSLIVMKKGGKNELTNCRSQYLTALRNATLLKDSQGQATLVNIIFYSFFQNREYMAARHFVDSIQFPDACSSSQNARYSYSLAKLLALEGKYHQAEEHLLLTQTRAPKSALGFRSACIKLLSLVKLLQGVIPKRAAFFQPGFEVDLKPYLDIATSVRDGNIKQFDLTIANSQQDFENEGILSLVIRLRTKVIQTGLKRLCLVYSSLPISDITSKLSLQNDNETEVALSRAIKEGVIQAEIDFEGRFMRVIEERNIIETDKPQLMMEERINQCLEMNEKLVKSMRYATLRNWDEENEKLKKEREDMEREFGALEDLLGDEDPDFGGGPSGDGGM
ncbi:putative 26S proteasome non-ATPase regulatory subunit 3 [Blattamonas nauphoetae]|uniref:26S proteasome non-ATPase regulatory subunit 3 n=1 Tax=Blattamonas nauphoetae TaxID=2049346 RepID=A0ABQ9YMQ7_9EUKA|nr:putative 26S proteasome non-ATPase regulatory subunit 3 [Blattamonas nauphoetae]